MVLRIIFVILGLLVANAAGAQVPYRLVFTPVPADMLSADDRAAGYALGSRGVYLYFVPAEKGSRRGTLILGQGGGRTETLLSLGPVVNWSGSGPLAGGRCGSFRGSEPTEIVGLDVDRPYVGPDGDEEVVPMYYVLEWPIHLGDGSTDFSSELGGTGIGPRPRPLSGWPPEAQRCE